MGNRCADHVTPLYPQKLALTSPTGGGRSVGIVRSRTKATEFSLVYNICGMSLVWSTEKPVTLARLQKLLPDTVHDDSLDFSNEEV